ncbi:MAG: flagellar biosynthesis protein FliQ, partial [Bacillota bacterium]
ISREALYRVLLILAPVLGLGLLTGLVVAILQATTQIQEQTLAFIPKILAVLISIGIFGPWMMNTILDFVDNLFSSIPQYLG